MNHTVKFDKVQKRQTVADLNTGEYFILRKIHHHAYAKMGRLDELLGKVFVRVYTGNVSSQSSCGVVNLSNPEQIIFDQDGHYLGYWEVEALPKGSEITIRVGE